MGLIHHSLTLVLYKHNSIDFNGVALPREKKHSNKAVVSSVYITTVLYFSNMSRPLTWDHKTNWDAGLGRTSDLSPNWTKSTGVLRGWRSGCLRWPHFNQPSDSSLHHPHSFLWLTSWPLASQEGPDPKLSEVSGLSCHTSPRPYLKRVQFRTVQLWSLLSPALLHTIHMNFWLDMI